VVLPSKIRAEFETSIGALLPAAHAADPVVDAAGAERQAQQTAARIASGQPDLAEGGPVRHDFGDVRIHTGEAAARSATAFSARAYTVGPQIAFNVGQFAPATADGRRTLAHELTHVVQQRRRGLDELVQCEHFGTETPLDSLPGTPWRARLLGPYRPEAVALELYGDATVEPTFASDDGLVVLIDEERLLPRWREVFEKSGQPMRNTWPFPGFSADERATYVDDQVEALAVNLMAGHAFLSLGEGRSTEVPLPWFDAADANVLPLLPVASDRAAAEALAAEYGDAARERGMTAVAFHRQDGLIMPTLFSPQTTPRIFSVYSSALDAARADARATAEGFANLLLWYIGARMIPGAGRGAGAARTTGQLVIQGGRTLSTEEMIIVGKLLKEGRNVTVLVESTAQGARTADFLVDGVLTELKSISNLTSKDLSGALGRRILEGAGQGQHIIADVQRQAGLTRELAARAIRRAFGADTLKRIQQIRVIGEGFDITVPRI